MRVAVRRYSDERAGSCSMVRDILSQRLEDSPGEDQVIEDAGGVIQAASDWL